MNPAHNSEMGPSGLAGLSQLGGLVIDMDGVLWRGEEPIPGLEGFIRTLRRQEIRFVLATNNNTQTPAGFAAKAGALGAEVLPEEVLTATTATIHYLHKQYPQGTALYAIGEKALKEQLESAGFILAERDVAAVVAAMDRNLTYEMLKRATFLINAGAAFIGANPDVVYPTPEGLAPGSGMVLAALQATTNRPPIIIGKPEIGMFQIALERMELPAARCASLGDRLDTDIAGAQRAGLKSILVLSGVTKPEVLAASSIQPDWVFPSIRELADALES
jgi:4-nitrophenyl phosphatase